MSSIMIYFLLWTMAIYKQECAVIHLDHRNRNTFDYIIQKYMDPLRRLSANLPNHAIEMQIEFHGSVPKEVTINPQRRVIHLVDTRAPKSIARSQDMAETEALPPADAAPSTAGLASNAKSSQPSTAMPATPSIARQEPETDPTESSKIPVFMEDLKKALDELEKKLATSSDFTPAMTTPSNTPNTVVGGTTQVQNIPIRSIDDIVQMIKRGIHVEHRMPKAGDEKLEWLQIKIPKSMQL